MRRCKRGRRRDENILPYFVLACSPPPSKGRGGQQPGAEVVIHSPTKRYGVLPGRNSLTVRAGMSATPVVVVGDVPETAGTSTDCLRLQEGGGGGQRLVEVEIMMYACPNATKVLLRHSGRDALSTLAQSERTTSWASRMVGGGRRQGEKTPGEAVSQFRLSGGRGRILAEVGLFWKNRGGRGPVDEAVGRREVRPRHRVGGRRKREMVWETPEEAMPLTSCWYARPEIPEEVGPEDGRGRPERAARHGRRRRRLYGGGRGVESGREVKAGRSGWSDPGPRVTSSWWFCLCCC